MFQIIRNSFSDPYLIPDLLLLIGIISFLVSSRHIFISSNVLFLTNFFTLIFFFVKIEKAPFTAQHENVSDEHFKGNKFTSREYEGSRI